MKSSDSGKAKTHAIQNHVIIEATKKTDQAHRLAGEQSKAAQTGSIRRNRAEQKLAERQSEAWKIGGEKSVQEELDLNGNSNHKQESLDIYVPALSNADKIREIRKNKKGGRND